MGRTIKPVKYTEGFLLFWDQCIRKVGKQAAQRAWNHHGLEIRAQEVAEKMAHDANKVFKKRDREKVPHPSTWINDGRYDDEMSVDPNELRRRKWQERLKKTGKTIEYW